MVKRRWVRESDSTSVSAKRYAAKRGNSGELLEAISTNLTLVILDMRRGSLDSLDRYLKEHRGIPHPEVAAELAKLLSGDLGATKYRLIAIEHPDAPTPNPGPRRRTSPREPTQVELELVAAFERALVVERGKKHRAEEAAAMEKGTNITKVQRARAVVRAYEAAKWRITPEQIDEFIAKLRAITDRP